MDIYPVSWTYDSLRGSLGFVFFLKKSWARQARGFERNSWLCGRVDVGIGYFLCFSLILFLSSCICM